MKKFLIKYGWVILLVGVIVSACGTAPTPVGPIEVQMTSMAAQVQACATLQSLGTPYPCNPPTATPMPTETPTPLPTPTATPYSGWKQYTEDGEYVRDMPPGWVPDCQGVVGCPGKTFIYYQNGQPVSGGAEGTPGYWPWVLGGIPAVLAILVLFYVLAYGMAAPQRAAAKVMLLMGQAYADAARGGSAMLPPPEEPDKIQVRKLIFLLDKFNKAHPVPKEYLLSLGQQFHDKYQRNEKIPLVEALQMLRACDRQYGVRITQSFGQFLSDQLPRR